MARRWTPKEVKAEAVARVVAGDNVCGIARDAGVTFQTVYKWVEQAGALPPQKVSAREYDQQFDDALALFSSGMSVPDVATTLGMPSNALYSRLAKVGVLTERQRKPHVSQQDKTAAVQRVLAGEPVATVAASFGRSAVTVYRWLSESRREASTSRTGATDKADTPNACLREDVRCSKVDAVPASLNTQAASPPADLAEDRVKVGRGVKLSLDDRITIEHGCRQGLSARKIAKDVGRHHSVIVREIARNGWKVPGDGGEVKVFYNARRAHASAQERARRPKTRKLDDNLALRSHVVKGLTRRWSPGRISAWLRHTFTDDESMRISHEAIYSALYIQGKGSLRAELEAVMQTQKVLIRGGKTRKPRRRNAGVLTGRSWIEGAEITKRSPEVDDRAVPGHWEGDLVIGKGGKSALITLVERTSRYTLLGHLPAEHTSITVIEKIQQMVKDLDAEQLKTITWDQGVEMAETVNVKIKDGCEVYFCDPHSPWQRPTNENTNGEIRRRFYKKGTDFAAVTPEHVAWVQNELNETPRQILGGATPREILNELFNRGASTT